jgi:hypothetical protein
MTVKTPEITLEAPVVAAKVNKTKREPRIPTPPFKITQDQVSSDRFVEELDRKLLDTLRDATSDIDNLYDDKPRIPVESLFDELGTLKGYVDRFGKNAKLTQLIRYLEEAHAEQMARVHNMMERGVVSFGALRLLLRPNTDVVIHGDQDVGACVVNSRYRQSVFGAYLEIDYEYITSNGREFRTTQTEIHVGAYTGVKSISSLPIRPATDADRARLTERGRIYAEVAVGAHYKQFEGQMQVVKWWSYTPMRATGRCMIDIATHNQFKDDARYRPDRGDSQIQNLQEDQLWQTDPYVLGFSFVTKQWGKFPVAQISNIEFRDNAYDQLVLDAEKKHLVRALVQDNSSGFADIISGKGGGCIFLLHGEPGVGKTLTAEAVSELLRRPLYSVSVGELGTDPASLEKNLRQILDVAQIWNAVILIDEADIFLEKRTSGDILRNACVSVFLRLTEYHQGVMFLTTNRVTEFDPAFYSRITVAIKYDNLSSDNRLQIWQNLLLAASMPTAIDVDKLCGYNINGRQIKNAIRLAHGLAKSQGVEVSTAHLEHVITMSAQFLEDIK